jgi:hypothetical protein
MVFEPFPVIRAGPAEAVSRRTPLTISESALPARTALRTHAAR